MKPVRRKCPRGGRHLLYKGRTERKIIVREGMVYRAGRWRKCWSCEKCHKIWRRMI